uniref:Phage protein n=1 Tax=Strongyloides papillosus TaxID=174720 RepID=A0A0N5CGE4_STREA
MSNLQPLNDDELFVEVVKNGDLTGVDHLYDLSRDEICQLYQQEKISNENKTRTNEMLTRRKNELEDRLAVAETICNV